MPSALYTLSAKAAEMIMANRRELYRNANGDSWFLGREPQTGNAFVIHQPNAPSGARLSPIEVAAFLSAETKGPEHQALLRLIGTLVEVPPFADRTQGAKVPADAIGDVMRIATGGEPDDREDALSKPVA